MLSQAELHTVNGALTALDDDLDMIQQQLEHQMQAQDQHQEDARYTFGVSCTVMHLESVLLKSCLPACQQAVPLCEALAEGIAARTLLMALPSSRHALKQMQWLALDS